MGHLELVLSFIVLTQQVKVSSLTVHGFSKDLCGYILLSPVRLCGEEHLAIAQIINLDVLPEI